MGVSASQALARRFLELYPGEAAIHLNSIPQDQILALLKREPVPVAAKVFLRLRADVSASLIDRMPKRLFKQLYEHIDPARGAILLARLDSGTVEDHLKALPKKLADEYRELMSYPADTAGNLMDPRVTTFLPNDSVTDVLGRIRSLKDLRIIDVCVTDEDGKLIGVVPLQNVAVAQPEQEISELILREPLAANMMEPREDVVKLLESRKLTSLPVVDLDGSLLGIIRYDALVSAAQHEASEDVQAMFGAGRDERALSKVSFAVRKRLPWLEMNLATAFLAAIVVGLFESTIARYTALAIFLPVVAGQSGNTGSQALAVTMRGLALREIRARHWFKVASKEVGVGFLNGCAVSLTTAVVVYLWMSSSGLALVIGLSMVFSMVIAGFSGALIPILLKRMGQDPAQSSSIILTTVTDVCGFMSFLGLATLLESMLPPG